MSGLLYSGVSAAGTTGPTATALPSAVSFVQVSVCAAAAGIILPTGVPSGKTIKVRNDGVGYLFVYPPTGGTINSLAVDAGQILAQVGGQADFVAKGDNLGWFVYNLVGIPAVPISNATSPTLTLAHSGAVIQISKTGGAANTITLPTPVGNPGLRFKFVQNTAAGAGITTILTPVATSLMGAWTIDTAGGFAIVNSLQGAAITKLGFLAVSLWGDYAEFWSDGTTWVCDAHTNVAAGMAFAA